MNGWLRTMALGKSNNCRLQSFKHEGDKHRVLQDDSVLGHVETQNGLRGGGVQTDDWKILYYLRQSVQVHCLAEHNGQGITRATAVFQPNI